RIVVNMPASTGAPTVTAIAPYAGPTTGGTSIAITGAGFTGATAVKFGATNASSYTVNSDVFITATSPANSAGIADVTVVNSYGTSATSGNDQFTYFSGTSGTVPTTPLKVYGQTDFTGNGPGTSATSLNAPYQAAANSYGDLYLADTGNNRVLYFA